MRLSAALLTVAAALSGAASAQAATVERNGSGITYVGDAIPNAVQVSGTKTEITFTDPAGVVGTGGCSTTSATSATCSATSVFTVAMRLDDGPDAVTLSGQLPNTFTLSGGDGADTLRGNPNGGTTTFIGGEGTDTYEPGPGQIFVSYEHLTEGDEISINDERDDPEGEMVPPSTYAIYGGQGDDTLRGSARGDLLLGLDGDDRLLAGDGADSMNGGAGTDEIDAGPGDDRLLGGDGDDLQDGGPGEDVLLDGEGSDTLRGGDGIDRAEIGVFDPATNGGRDASASLNDVRDDGPAGEGDDIRADVEDITAVGAIPPAGRATLRGDADFNVLSGSTGGDTIVGGGGGDILRGLAGDDTLDARDGSAGRVECGLGTDSARVDAADTVEDCENVDRATPTPAETTARPDEDRPPAVAFAAPAADTPLSAATTIRVDASDDRSIGRVVLLRDGRVVGTDTTAPYDFPLGLTAGDVGRSTLVAVAVDSSEQTATAVRAVRVARFAPTVTAGLARARDRTLPYRFQLTGAVRLPAGLTATRGCTGVVSVQVKRDRRTISTRRARLTRTCAFSSSVTFRNPRRLGSGRLRFTARFQGNAVLAPATARSIAGRAG